MTCSSGISTSKPSICRSHWRARIVWASIVILTVVIISYSYVLVRVHGILGIWFVTRHCSAMQTLGWVHTVLPYTQATVVEETHHQVWRGRCQYMKLATMHTRQLLIKAQAGLYDTLTGPIVTPCLYDMWQYYKCSFNACHAHKLNPMPWHGSACHTTYTEDLCCASIQEQYQS